MTSTNRPRRVVEDVAAAAYDAPCLGARPAPSSSTSAGVHDPTDPIGRLPVNALAMIAEFEADLIRMRTREGMKVARAKGRLRGRQPKLSPRQQAHLVALHNAGQHPSAELVEPFNVARSTMYRALTRAAARTPTAPSAPMGGRS